MAPLTLAAVAPDATAAPPPTLGFFAAGSNGGVYPPDPGGAVGPHHVVGAFNNGVVLDDRSGTALAGIPITQFWHETGLPDLFYYRRPHLGATAWAAAYAWRHRPRSYRSSTRWTSAGAMCSCGASVVFIKRYSKNTIRDPRVRRPVRHRGSRPPTARRARLIRRRGWGKEKRRIYAGRRKRPGAPWSGQLSPGIV